MKQYIIPSLLVVAGVLAIFTNTITIQTSPGNYNNTTSDRSTQNSKSPFSLSGLQHISGELLISPNTSRERWSQIIGSSQDFLYVWMYNITHKESRALIKGLAKAGISVHMILEDRQYGSSSKNTVRGRGIQIKNDSKLKTNFMHAKTLISSGLYIIQTANLTFGAFEKQREYYIIGADQNIQDNLKQLFEKDRSGVPINPSDIHPNILLCPTDCRSKIIGLLQGAKQSIWIQNQYISDPAIRDILQSQRNLDLKITLPKNKENEQTAVQFTGNIRLLSSPYIHAKALLIDDTYLLISSINFSSNSLDNNREIGIIITNAEAIQAFQQQFLQDRQRTQ